MDKIQPKNPELLFLQIQEQAKHMAELCDQIEITDNTSFLLAEQNYEVLNKFIKKIEKVRKDESGVYFKEFKKINAFAKSLSDPLKSSLEIGKQKILDYSQGNNAPAKISYILKYEIMDEVDIPREWLTLDETKVKAYIRETEFIGDGEIINGLLFYREPVVKIS